MYNTEFNGTNKSLIWWQKTVLSNLQESIKYRDTKNDEIQSNFIETDHTIFN